jgi:phospholipase D
MILLAFLAQREIISEKMGINMPRRSQEAVRALKGISSLSSKPLKGVIAILIAGFLVGVAFEEMIGIGTWHSYAAPTDKINVCFTPPSGCGALIIQQISKAQESIYVQAFNFYSDPIANALIKAKKRGVRVKIILDKTNNENAKSQAARVMAEGIEVVIDSVAGIAHNKVMILDEKKVITGSFNFSDSADTRNAENVLLIDDKGMAREYLQNWKSRYSSSRVVKW